MNAGLPGFGIGGIFYVLAALVAPVVELRRIRRGESSPERRRSIARQFAMALAIVAMILALMPLVALGIACLVLLVVVLGAKGLELEHRRRQARRHALRARRSLIYLRQVDDLDGTDLGRAALELDGCER